jgi:hypothetical protein
MLRSATNNHVIRCANDLCKCYLQKENGFNSQKNRVIYKSWHMKNVIKSLECALVGKTMPKLSWRLLTQERIAPSRQIANSKRKTVNYLHVSIKVNFCWRK